MLLNSADLAFMRETQQAAMHDTGRVLVYTAGTRDEYGADSAATYTEQAPIDCGVEMRAGTERNDAAMVTVNYDAVLRMPLTVAMSENDRFEVLSRYAEYPDALIYGVAAPIQRGATACRVLLRKVVK